MMSAVQRPGVADGGGSVRDDVAVQVFGFLRVVRRPAAFYSALPCRDFSPPFRVRVGLIPNRIPAQPFHCVFALHPVFFRPDFTGCCFLRLILAVRMQLIVAMVPYRGTPPAKEMLCRIPRHSQTLPGRLSRCGFCDLQSVLYTTNCSVCIFSPIFCGLRR